MSFKTRIAAAAVTALAAITGGGVAAGTAGAATPSCGFGLPCVNVFSHEFGDYGHPSFVADVFHGGVKVGQPVILFKASNSDPAEDFTLSFQGTVSDFFGAGLVSSQVMLHYGCTPGFTFTGSQGTTMTCAGGSADEPAFELEYAPYGVDSGLCAGVPFTAVQGENVSLQPCGASSKTVWIWDTYDQPPPWDAFNGFTYPAVNGSDVNFSHPFVLSYPRSGEPWAKPRPQLQVTNLTGFSNGFGPIVGQVPDSQLWGGTIGELK